MPHEIRIPRLGWSMEEGIFIGWLKRDGEKVYVGDALYELEGEKALQQIESVDAGILRLPQDGPQPGSVVTVGSLIGYLALEEEQSSGTPSVSGATGLEPVERRRADYALAPNQSAAHTSVSLANPDSKVASPRAKRLARELGVDWSAIAGTGNAARIREADVLAAAASTRTSDSALSAAQTIPITPRRKAINNRLRISRQRTLPVTITTTADATNLVALRERLRSQASEPLPTYADVVVALLVRVLKQHRLLAARWQENHDALLLPGDDGFHIGIAVHNPDGLLVPVLREVGPLSLADVAARSKTLIDLARSGRLAASDMQDGVFTITSLGAFGVDTFTPMINYPGVAILGLGAIRREPVVLDSDRIGVQHRITLSLTFDHSAIDGVPAAEFLRDLGAALESPAAQLPGV